MPLEVASSITVYHMNCNLRHTLVRAKLSPLNVVPPANIKIPLDHTVKYLAGVLRQSPAEAVI